MTERAKPLIATRRRFLAAAGAGIAVGSSLGRGMAADPLKVGFVYIGPIGDFGWTYQHEVGRRAVAEKFGAAVQANYVESVAEGPDCEHVLRQLAQDGAKLVFATSFGYMNFVQRVAKEFPDVAFEHATGYKTAKNVGTYDGRFYEGRAVCGTIAGMVSKSNVIGYVGSFPIPEVVMGINALTLAARKINPAIMVKIIWVNGWFDPGKEADAAKSLIDQGADIICTHTDSPAVVQTAEARGVFSFGQDSDMRKFGPKSQLSSVIDVWKDYYGGRVQAVIDGTWSSDRVWGGLKEGMVAVAPYGPGVTEPARKAADATRDAIVAGTGHPFTGPVTDNKGTLRVPAGTVMADPELQKMDWYVEGVQV